MIFLKKKEKFNDDFEGIIFDLVRIEIRLACLSTDDIEYIDFFLSSVVYTTYIMFTWIVILKLVFKKPIVEEMKEKKFPKRILYEMFTTIYGDQTL